MTFYIYNSILVEKSKKYDNRSSFIIKDCSKLNFQVSNFLTLKSSLSKTSLFRIIQIMLCLWNIRLMCTFLYRRRWCMWFFLPCRGGDCVVTVFPVLPTNLVNYQPYLVYKSNFD